MGDTVLHDCSARDRRIGALARSALGGMSLFGLIAAGTSSPARANGRFPRADQLLAMPDRPDALVLRATWAKSP